MTDRYAIILAAGKGTRMKSKLYKVLHPVCEKPMVQHVVDNVSALKMKKIIAVVGHGAEQVKEQLGTSCEYVLQEEQLGTAHAVQQAESLLAGKDGITLVICGDTPLITSETIAALFAHHEQTKAKATILTAVCDDPTGYGRIIRDANGVVQRIVEHKDATEEEKAVKEINTGTYCFDNKALFETLSQVDNDNAQGEYYLPDVIEILKNNGEVISAYRSSSFEETLGINDRIALSEAEQIMRKRINMQHMINGVTIIDPSSTYIGMDVSIGKDTILYPGTSIFGKTVIGENAHIGPNSEIRNCIIGDYTEIKHSVATDSKIGNNVTIGPFAHIRPSSAIDDNVKIGNFVEIKNTSFGKGSKASHLSYIGDAEVEEDVNIGCGSITVNYDGKQKHVTKIKAGAFIGCNSNLIAPVTIGKKAYIAAGSTITDNVPDEALSIARQRQTNKEGYVNKKK